MSFECLRSGYNCRLRLEITFTRTPGGGVIDDHLDSKRCFQPGDTMGTVGNFMAGRFSAGSGSTVTRCDGVCVWSVLSSIPVLLV